MDYVTLDTMIAPTVLYDKWIAKPEFAGLWALFIIQETCQVLWTDKRELSYAATIYNKENGIALDCYTDLPGIQIYTGTFLDTIGKNKTPHGKFAGICLETQGFPNSPNFRHFPSPILKAGEEFYSKTVYKAYVK